MLNNYRKSPYSVSTLLGENRNSNMSFLQNGHQNGQRGSFWTGTLIHFLATKTLNFVLYLLTQTPVYGKWNI